MLFSTAAPTAAITGQFDQLFTRKALAWNDLKDHYDAEYDSKELGVLAIGDSMFGTIDPIGGVELRNLHGMIPIARRVLQALMNDPSIKGGMGFVNWTNGGLFALNRIPIQNGGSDAPTPGTDGDTYLGTDVNSAGGGARELGLASGKTRYNGAQLVGTGSMARMEKRAVKKFCIVGRRYSGGPTIAIDVSSSAWPARGAGNQVTGTWNMNNATTEYGARSAVFTLPNELLDNRLAQRGGASGGVAYTDGVILYNGDDGSNCVQVHEHGHPGSGVQHWGENSRVATIDSFTRRDGSPSSNCRVAVISFLTNDANSYPTQSLAQIKAGFESIAQRCIDRGMKVIWVLPPEPDASAFYAGNILADAYRPSRLALYDIQASAAFAPHMEILDLGILTGYRAYSDVALQWGLFDNDMVHLGLQGHMIAGVAIAYRIAAGFAGIG